MNAEEPQGESRLARRVVACLDVAGGRVVKGVQFVHLRDAGDPVALAEWYYREGVDELVILDITATLEARGLLLNLIRSATERVFIPVTVGGGVRTLDDMRALLGAGADKVAMNSAAVRDPALLTRAAETFGRQAVVAAIDARRSATVPSGWEVVVRSGTVATRLDAVAWAQQAVHLGAGEILLTSIDRDGTRDGYDIALTRAVSGAVSVPVVASGGAGTLQHLAEVLTKGLADAALAASIFHDGHFTIGQSKAFLSGQGIEIRI